MQEDQDTQTMTRDQAWAIYFANHPEVLASYGHQNGYWPNCEHCGLGR